MVKAACKSHLMARAKTKSMHINKTDYISVQASIPVESSYVFTALTTCLLQDVIETQERTITDLLKSVKEQHEQLSYQKTKIKSLEDKVSILVSIILMLFSL